MLIPRTCRLRGPPPKRPICPKRAVLRETRQSPPPRRVPHVFAKARPSRFPLSDACCRPSPPTVPQNRQSVKILPRQIAGIGPPRCPQHRHHLGRYLYQPRQRRQRRRPDAKWPKSPAKMRFEGGRVSPKTSQKHHIHHRQCADRHETLESQVRRRGGRQVFSRDLRHKGGIGG